MGSTANPTPRTATEELGYILDGRPNLQLLVFH